MIITVSIIDGISLLNKQVIKKKLVWLPTTTKKKEVTDSELKELIKGGDDIFDDLDYDESPKKEIHVEPYKKITVVPVDFPMEETISNFKTRIFEATGIPPFRQHIWSQKSGVLGYSVRFTGSVEAVNIENIKKLDLFEGIPINMNYFHSREDMEITTQEWCEPMVQGDYYLVDIDDFIKKNKSLPKVVEDVGNLHILYYSFIIQYWPQLSMSAFVEYVNGRIAQKYPELIPKPLISTKMSDAKSDIKGFIKAYDIYVSIPYRLSINMRNLFDIVETSESIPLVITSISSNVKLLKKNILARTDALLKIDTPHISTDVCLLYYTEQNVNIVYSITEKEYIISVRIKNTSFGDIKKSLESITFNIMEVVALINSYGRRVISASLPDFDSQKINTIRNVEKIITIQKKLSSSESDKFIEALYKYGDCTENTVKADVHTLTWRRGMREYDFSNYSGTSNNMYEYLYDNSSLSSIYHQKRIEIRRRVLSIEIYSYGMTERELETFQALISNFAITFRASVDSEEIDYSNTNKSKMLIQFDPELYDLKKRHDMATGYTTKCQHTKQPIVVGKETKQSIKYWNFTNDTDAYYECPNKMFPYFGFLNKKIHVKGYCLPCCYSKRQDILSKRKYHAKCMSEHMVKGTELVDSNITKSRHIISYIKILDIGRISRLPENTLEPLLYNVSKVVADDECVNNNQYFIFGVLQHLKNISYIGAMFSIASALRKDFISFLSETMIRLKESTDLRADIKNEKILEIFTNLFVNYSATELTSEYINQLFISISQRLWNVSIITFRGTVSNKYYIDIPPEVLDIADYLLHEEVILLLEDQIVDEHIGEVKSVYYPIYQINAMDFFRKKKVEKTVFTKTDSVVTIVQDIVVQELRKNRTTLSIYKIKQIKNVKMQYVDKSGTCYAVEISDKSRTFYFPISHYKHSNDYGEITYESPKLSELPTAAEVFEILEHFSIKCDCLLMLKKEVVGAKAYGVEYPFQSEDVRKTYPAYSKLPVHTILYHPFTLINLGAPKVDFRAKNITRCLYNNHIYDIFLFQLCSYLLEFRDKSIRDVVIDAIKSSQMPDYDFKSDSDRIHSLLKSKKMDKKEKLSHLDSSVFNFDNPLIVFAEKNNDVSAIKGKLSQIASKVFVEMKPNFEGSVLANTFAPCSTSQQFPCHNGKMMIQKEKLEDLIQIVASNIVRVGVYEVVTHGLLKNYINQFHFTHRKNEIIHISI